MLGKLCNTNRQFHLHQLVFTVTPKNTNEGNVHVGICIVSFLCFFQQKNSKKENIPAGSNTTAKDVDKKKNMTTSSKTVNNNTKLSSGLKEHCVNSTNLKQSGKPEHHTSKR